MNKNFFKITFALGLVVPCAFSLVACGEKDNDKNSAGFKTSQDISTSTTAIIEELTNNYYNSSTLGTSKKYTVEEIKEKDSDFNYYVEIGEVSNIEDVNKVEIGGTTFKKDDVFNLSIGNNNFISDKCFLAEENKICVAAPIIAFESVNNEKIKINDKEFDFDLNKAAESKSFTNASFSSGTTNTVEAKQNGTYDLTFKDAKSYLKLYYEGATASDIVLTKKVVTGSGVADLNNVANYGLTKVETETNNPLGLYPIGYSNSALTEEYVTKYDGATMHYDAYIINGGIVSATLNFDIVLPATE